MTYVTNFSEETADARAAGQPLLSTHDITRSFGQVRALAGVSLEVAAGETVAIMGPSGSGKSTLLHCLSGVLTPDAGEVRLAGNTLSGLSDKRRSHTRLTEFGFVFQDNQLIPELPSRENVALPLMLTGSGRGKALAEADAMLARLGIADLAGASLILVTHDPNVAAWCSRLVEIRDGLVHSDRRLGASREATR